MRLVLLLILSLLSPQLLAAAIEIDPIHVYLTQAAPIGAFAIRNHAKEPIVVQIQQLAWSQNKGKDEHQKTNALFVTPPIIEIGSDQSQTVRVALREQNKSEIEQTFRLLVQEIPKKNKEKYTGLRTILNISIPVFISPIKPIENHLQWSIQQAHNKAPLIKIENKGNAHIQVTHLKLTSADEKKTLFDKDVFEYVLSNHSKTITINSALPLLKEVHVTATTDAGKLSSTIKLSSR